MMNCVSQERENILCWLSGHKSSGVCFALYFVFVRWVERSDQMSFENPGLQLLFFSFTWKQILQYKHNYWGTSSAWSLNAAHLNGPCRFIVFTPCKISHFTFICLNDDLQESYKWKEWYVRLCSILFHLFEIKSLTITAQYIFLFD